MLKILSGTARGRKLIELPRATHVRPILARIKKSVFDIIRMRLQNAAFLDIYSGTGAVGIEALSEGAASAAFVESDPNCVTNIQENLKMLGMEKTGRVYRMNAMGDLSGLPKPFDVIFMGPPYVDRAKKALALTVPTIENVLRYNLAGPNTLIIGQHHKKEPVQAVDPLEIVRQEKYGDTLVSFFKFKAGA